MNLPGKLNLRRNRKTLFSLFLVSLLSISAALSLQFQWLSFFEKKLLDFRFISVWQDITPSQQVVFIDIDDTALTTLSKDFGTWPWPRGDIMSTRLADYILQGEPSGVFFDILYTEYSPKLPEVELPEQDQILVYSALSSPAISHAVQFSAPDLEEPKELPLSTDTSFAVDMQISPDAVSFPRGGYPHLPFPELTEFSNSLNLVNEEVDRDGVSRMYTLFMEYGGKIYPSMAAKALMFMRGATNWSVYGHQVTYTDRNGQVWSIPLAEDGRFQLNFYHDLNQFIHIPADTVIASAQAWASGQTNSVVIPPETFRGKSVIIGTTAQGLKDLKISPTGSNYGGPFLHATAMSNLLSGHYLKTIPLTAEILLKILGLTIIVLLTLWIGNERIRSFLGVLWLILQLGAIFAAFHYFGIILDMANTLVVLLLGYFGSVSFLSLTEGSEKRYIRSAFSTYLSPEVIRELESDPDKLKLGGTKRSMTALFTDVKGFSTFSENMDPNDLVRLLNEYLGAMSDIILDNSGTIDKYEGDAIIAFWGAPLDQPDHAARALSATVKMRRCEAALNERLMAGGLASSPLLTRFGINSGDMTVGNMGTSRRMNYTIMGNHVNLAARLEGVNKQYGTWILTSQYTMDMAGDGFVTRALDRVSVVGISTPIRLYEVLEEKGMETPAQREALEIFSEGMGLFEKLRWSDAKIKFEEVLKVLPQDGPAKTFRDRTASYIKNPPAKDWDGVFRLTAK